MNNNFNAMITQDEKINEEVEKIGDIDMDQRSDANSDYRMTSPIEEALNLEQGVHHSAS